MRFHPFEVTTPHITYLCLGGFIVLFGMFSLFLRSKLYIGEACWAFLFGVIVGPYGANVLNPHAWADTEAGVNNIVLEFTRVVLAIGVFAIGVELPKAYMRRHWKSLFFLLCPVMTWGWFVSAALIYALIPGLSFLSSLAVAACLTPTDPILAAAVVGGKWADKHVPTHIRHLLAAESACNDGAAFPFLFIALYLLLDGSTGDAIRDWFLLLWLYQVVVGVIVGSLIGIGFRYLMKFCERKELIDRHSYVAQYLSLAMLTIGVCTLLGSDDLLAAFACGTAFAWDGFFNHQTEESNFSSVIDLLFNIAAFIFLGAWMPFGSFQDEKLTLSVWRLIVIAILVLFLRRLPIMVALYKWIPDVKTFREAVFSGHFGPIGVGAIFISTLAVETIHSSNKKNEELELLAATIQPITAFMVLCSITIHGLSIPGFSLGRRVHTVTRTWSRSAVVLGSGGPEWMNQTRPVKRPEDIVINRDHMNAMELGMAPQRDIEKAEVSTIDASMTLTQINSRPHSLKGTGSVDGSALMSGSTTTEASGSGSAAGTTPPASTEGQTADGDERMDQSGAVPPTNSGGGDGGDETEWREGRHRVVERRGGPGEDVSVTVYDDEEEPQRRGRQPLSERVRHALSRVGSTSSHIQPTVTGGGVIGPAPPILRNTSDSGGGGGTGDDEEGWASDHSFDDEAGGPSATPRVRLEDAPSPTSSGHPKSGKTKGKPKFMVGGWKRSLRDHVHSHGHGHGHGKRKASVTAPYEDQPSTASTSAAPSTPGSASASTSALTILPPSASSPPPASAPTPPPIQPSSSDDSETDRRGRRGFMRSSPRSPPVSGPARRHHAHVTEKAESYSPRQCQSLPGTAAPSRNSSLGPGTRLSMGGSPETTPTISPAASSPPQSASLQASFQQQQQLASMLMQHQQVQPGVSQSGQGQGQGQSIRHQRLDTLRRPLRSREESPSRSVRFADESARMGGPVRGGSVGSIAGGPGESARPGSSGGSGSTTPIGSGMGTPRTRSMEALRMYSAPNVNSAAGGNGNGTTMGRPSTGLGLTRVSTMHS